MFQEVVESVGGRVQLWSAESSQWLHEHYTAPGYGKWVTLGVTGFSILGQIWAATLAVRKFWERWGWLVASCFSFGMALTAVPLAVRKYRELKQPTLLKAILSDLAGSTALVEVQPNANYSNVASGRVLVKNCTQEDHQDRYAKKPWTLTAFEVHVGGNNVTRLLSNKERRKVWAAADKCVQAKREKDARDRGAKLEAEKAELLKKIL